MSRQSDPRFDNYTEVTNQGKVVGFSLEGDEHVYLFDKNNGWFDKQGKYFNANAIECRPPSRQGSQESQQQHQQQFKNAKKSNNKNERIQAIKQLSTIVQNYCEDDIIQIKIQTQPEIQDGQLQKFINQKYNTKVQCSWGCIKVKKNQCFEIIQLEGLKIKNSLIYIDIDLKNANQVYVQGNSINKIQKILIENDLQKGKDFGNMKCQDKKIIFQIKKDLMNKIMQMINCKIIQE